VDWHVRTELFTIDIDVILIVIKQRQVADVLQLFPTAHWHEENLWLVAWINYKLFFSSRILHFYIYFFIIANLSLQTNDCEENGTRKKSSEQNPQILPSHCLYF
jgi:hypothetical protein